jgi:hypothetical protein
VILIRWVDDCFFWEAVDEDSGRCLKAFHTLAEAEAWTIDEQARREEAMA